MIGVSGSGSECLQAADRLGAAGSLLLTMRSWCAAPAGVVVVVSMLFVGACCGCRKLCRGWSGGISVLVDESVTAGRSNDLEVPIWLVWWVGGDGW